MMEVNEFRLRNLVQDQSGNVLKVIELSEQNAVFYLLDRSKYPLKKGWSVQEILLTEKIILNIKGFQILSQNSAGVVYAFVENNVVNTDLQITHFTKGKFKGKFLRNGKEIKYLHKLQNLFFELLDGKELEFNEYFEFIDGFKIR